MTFAEKMRNKTNEVVERNTISSKEYYETSVKKAIEAAASCGYNEIILHADIVLGDLPEWVITSVIYDCAKQDGFNIDRLFGKILW